MFYKLTNGANADVTSLTRRLLCHILVFDVVCHSNDPALVTTSYSVGLSGQAPIAALRFVGGVTRNRRR